MLQSSCFAWLPIRPPDGRRWTFLMHFCTLPSLGEQMLWVRPAAINFWEITPSDWGKKAIKHSGGRDRRKQWQRTMHGITSNASRSPTDHSSFWLHLCSGSLGEMCYPGPREKKGPLHSKALLPFLWFIQQKVTEASFGAGPILSTGDSCAPNRPKPLLSCS